VRGGEQPRTAVAFARRGAVGQGAVGSHRPGGSSSRERARGCPRLRPHPQAGWREHQRPRSGLEAAHACPAPPRRVRPHCSARTCPPTPLQPAQLQPAQPAQRAQPHPTVETAATTSEDTSLSLVLVRVLRIGDLTETTAYRSRRSRAARGAPRRAARSAPLYPRAFTRRAAAHHLPTSVERACSSRPPASSASSSQPADPRGPGLIKPGPSTRRPASSASRRPRRPGPHQPARRPRRRGPHQPARRPPPAPGLISLLADPRRPGPHQACPPTPQARASQACPPTPRARASPALLPSGADSAGPETGTWSCGTVIRARAAATANLWDIGANRIAASREIGRALARSRRDATVSASAHHMTRLAIEPWRYRLDAMHDVA
jgi:hypothetical protein